MKPILVVFPTAKYYFEKFDKDIKDYFYQIINEVKNIYDFQFFDFFRSDLFDIEDFNDADHLNKKGAEKMTKLLDDLINW